MYLESEIVELKKSISQLKEGIISLSSMLNKHNKGTLFFGINDQGKICGVDFGKKTLSDISHEIRMNLKPLPSVVEVDNFVEEEKIIIKIYVEGDDAPYAAYGRYYTRISDSDVVMSSLQLQKYFENKSDNYAAWEELETEYTPEDVNEELLIECIRDANEKGRLDYIYKNAYEALNKLGLLTENGKLNNAGYFLFSKNKPVIIKEANYPTDSRTEFGEIKEFRGNIFECIKEGISYIQNHISFKSIIDGYRRIEIPEIPLRAIREILINSFAHAKYSIKGDFNQIVVYRSSVFIYNPGSIYKNLDPKKFASSEVGSKIRNIIIASVLYKCGYIDSFGTGFDRTFTLCAQNDIEYEYRNDDFGFTFIFKRNKNFLNDKINDKINDRISDVDRKIINCISSNKYITIPEISNKINKSEPTIHRHLTQLINKKMLRRIGSRKFGYWEII